LTYDREVIKVDVDRVAAANRGQFPHEKMVVDTARGAPAVWLYTTKLPAVDWFKLEFDAGDWSEGKSGFGSDGTPGAVLGTKWTSEDIWLRREVILPEEPLKQPMLIVHHDEDVEIYINGVLAATANGYTTEYEWLPMFPDGIKALKPGANLISVHCH